MKTHAGVLAGAACASALAGGVTVAGALILMTLAAGFTAEAPRAVWQDIGPYLFILIAYGAVATFIYFVGALVVGLPAFLILNRAGWTTPIHAILTGAALSGLAALLLTKGDASWLPMVGAAAVGGAVGGLVFRQVVWLNR